MGEHAPGLARLATEDRVAVEPDSEHKSIDDAFASGCNIGEGSK